MKQLYIKKSGFTLLELLVTASLFVVIAGLTVSIFGGVSKLQVSRKGSQALAGQLRQGEQQLKDDLQNTQTYSAADPTVKILNNTDGSTGSVFALRRYLVDSTGVTDSEWRIYCLANNELIRFRMPYTLTAINGAAPTINSGVTSISCANPSNIELSLFSNPGATWGTTPTLDEITDTQSTVQSLLFTQVQSDVSQTDPAFSGLFNALRIEMSAQDSVNDPGGAPIVSRIDLNRLPQ